MIGKEYLITLEKYAAQQSRIYGDACDIGVWETEEVRRELRWALDGLKGLEGGVAEKWSTGTSYLTFLAIERENGEDIGIIVKVSRNADRKGIFYSIELSRGPRPAQLKKALVVK